jgi:hypothetical protein
LDLGTEDDNSLLDDLGTEDNSLLDDLMMKRTVSISMPPTTPMMPPAAF